MMSLLLAAVLCWLAQPWAEAADRNGAPSEAAPRPPAATGPTVQMSATPADKPWTNSLGMAFVPVPGTETQFCLWETRVRDFDAFVKATGHDPSETAWSVPAGATKRNWRQPGFPQGPTYPVVWVSWEDAKQFCTWLTRKEQQEGKIGLNQRYRLPTDAEWSSAVGKERYPWGEMLPLVAKERTNTVTVARPNLDDRQFFPPPPQAGNYAGNERQERDSTLYRTIRGYEDGYVHSAPAGSFAANRLGLFDLGGNVWEWCEDWYHKEMLSKELEQKVPFTNDDGGGQRFRVLRGASWLDSHPAVLRSDCRFFEFPDHRSDIIGFRVVLNADAPSALPKAGR